MRRADFLAHVGWTGAGITFAIDASGVFVPASAGAETTSLRFVQISDSHIGFAQPANPDVAGTLAAAVERINRLAPQPAFVVHTGDITHLAKAEQFDSALQILRGLRAPLFAIPGEHDVIGEGRARYAAAFGHKDAPNGWYSWDKNGTHFVALVNVFSAETMGLLGAEQLDWLKNDLRPLNASTPVVVFGHVPLYAAYEPWGWTTEDGAQALALLRRFDAVTVLNGHIHQILVHREGSIRFFTAAATAYPQPAPGSAPKPGPVTLPPDRLLRAIGFRDVSVNHGDAEITEHDLS